jgi:hypothetical protein
MIWPAMANKLWAELESSRGRLALVVGGQADSSLKPLAEELRLDVVSVGFILTSGDAPPDSHEIQASLADARLLDHLGILFSPELRVDPIGLLRRLSRTLPRIAAWPGEVDGDRATFSRPGRRDYYERILDDAVILRPHERRFPDEPPYGIERIG